MEKTLEKNWPFLLFVLLVSAAYLSGIPAVPFHPDESTQIFMSSDLEIFFQNAPALYWAPDSAQPLRQHYRLLDAPLARLLIGFGRNITGAPPLQNDWDWSKDWQQNQQAGALPEERLLRLSRFSVAILFPFSLMLLYATAHALGGPSLGWASTILLAGNALVLLHTRRAMAESALLFTSILTLWALVRFQKQPLWIAAPAALAFNAKQTAAVFFLVGLAAVFWYSSGALPRRLLQGLLYTAIFLAITLLLNPYLWGSPFEAAQASLAARQALLQDQTGYFRLINPSQVLDTAPQRVVAMLAQLFVAPPAIADVSNYLPQTRLAENAYLANPLHTLLRGLPGGGLSMLLAVYGCILACLDACQKSFKLRRPLALLLFAFLGQALALLAAIPLSFQRYYLPLIPLLCLWSGYAILKPLQVLRATSLRRRPDAA